jgi:hypothetical protein
LWHEQLHLPLTDQRSTCRYERFRVDIFREVQPNACVGQQIEHVIERTDPATPSSHSHVRSRNSTTGHRLRVTVGVATRKPEWRGKGWLPSTGLTNTGSFLPQCTPQWRRTSKAKQRLTEARASFGVPRGCLREASIRFIGGAIQTATSLWATTLTRWHAVLVVYFALVIRRSRRC